jgi:peptidoglycan/xylan/chitin deacetylase (PgdA/CDA1 family)
MLPLLVVLLTLLGTTAAQAASPASIVFRGPAERKWIALTFDDNTVPGPSLATLSVLREYGVPATLFLVGYAVDLFPELTNEIARGVADGLFEVGDHSATHPDLTTLSATDLAAQIGGGTDAFQRLTGLGTTPFFRPPYGRNNSLVAQVGGGQGFTHLVLWDVGTEDWTGQSAATIENNIVSRAHNGAIVLLHLAANHTAEALPGIITRLRAAGYELVPVSALLRGERRFLDVDPGTEVGRAVADLTAMGMMNGYSHNYFGPTDTLTRRQAAKVVTLVGGVHTDVIDNPESRTFWDVEPTYDPQGNMEPYPYDFVEEAVACGLVRGTVDQRGLQVFDPYGKITRVQLAQILARMARQLKGYPERLDGPAKTFADVPARAAADVDLVARVGLMTGYSKSQFGAWDKAQRGHVAVVMERYLSLRPF